MEKAPSGADWLHEIKYDGYRVQLRIADGRVTVRTRQGLDWTERFETIAKAAAALPLKSGLIDGEIVALTETGIASFRALVEALRSGAGNLAFYAFDLLFVDGFDLQRCAVDREESDAAGPGRYAFGMRCTRALSRTASRERWYGRAMVNLGVWYQAAAWSSAS